jgi:hypothetical protein
MGMTLQTRMTIGLLVLAGVALLTGSVLVLGFAIAALAIGAIVFVTVPPLLREARTLWTTWRGRMSRRRAGRTARTNSPAKEQRAA